MKNGAKIRFIIHNILYDIHVNNKTLDDTNIQKIISKNSKKDISFITNVCLTSMRYYFHSIKIIDIYVKKKSRVHQKILLISAITQLVFLDFKQYAVINCSVEIAKKLNIYHGLINACLKKIALEKNSLKKINLSFSDLPIWFQNNTKKLSDSEKNIFLKTFYRKPDLHIVFKDLRKKNNFKEKLFSSSEKSGFVLEDKLVTDLSNYDNGDWWVQDFSSSFPILNISSKILNKKNIDLCAAPGGKSFQIMSINKKITLNDKSLKRLEVLKKNMMRLSFKSKILNYDILKLKNEEKYDFIILDSPCSSIGTIRKNPEIFFKKQAPDLDSLTKVQEKILTKSSLLLNKNGVILYMTCSFLEIETTNLINIFLSNNSNFILNDFFIKRPNKICDKIIKNKYMLTVPTDLEGKYIDGYFAAYLKKLY